MKTVARRTPRSLFWLLVPLILLATACDDRAVTLHEYQIVVNGSSTPVPVRYTGSYTLLIDGQEFVRDLSGTGSNSTSFQGTVLKRVRLQVSSGTGLAALTIYKDGQVIYETPPGDAQSPLLFTNSPP